MEMYFNAFHYQNAMKISTWWEYFKILSIFFLPIDRKWEQIKKKVECLSVFFKINDSVCCGTITLIQVELNNTPPPIPSQLKIMIGPKISFDFSTRYFFNCLVEQNKSAT